MDETENALLTLTDPLVFQRGGELVRVTIQPEATQQNGIKRAAGSAVISHITPAALGTLMSRVAEFRQFAKGGETKSVDPPDTLLRAFVEKREWQVPLLTGVLRSPTLRGDGSILEHAGYDRDSGFYLHAGVDEFPRVP